MSPDIAADLEAAGFVLIPVCSTSPHSHRQDGKPCASPGKIPTQRDWVSAAPGAFRPSPGENYGLALRAGDLVVDIDPRNFSSGDDPWARIVEDAKISVGTFTVETGGGGRHVYFRKPADVSVVQSLSSYKGLEFKTLGRQVVGPGSIHASGKPYRVANASPFLIQDAPSALLKLLAKTAPISAPSSTPAPLRSNDASAKQRFQSYLVSEAGPVSIEGQRGDETAFRVACKGRDFGLATAETLDLMIEHWNPKCRPPWSRADLSTKVSNAFKYAKSTPGGLHPSADFAPVSPSAEITWARKKNGEIAKTFENLCNFFRVIDGGLYKLFAKNDFTGRLEYANPAPWHVAGLPVARGISDDDLALVRGYLSSRHRYDASIQDIHSAIVNIAYKDRFHPVREYLKGLKWDGVSRVDTWLKTYVGAEDCGTPAYLAAVSRKTLCAAVMRVMKPGIKFDHVLVLEGPQDMGKSTVVEILGGEWSSDTPIDPHSRDTVDGMQGRWFIEIAELEIMRKADEDALKAFISRRMDRARLAYERTTSEFPRQSVFIATKNPRADGAYLRDDTGNRRWWPVRCRGVGKFGQVDFAGLKAARNQLFAEAVVLCGRQPAGEALYMDTIDLKDSAKSVVDQRRTPHEWTEVIAEWLDSEQPIEMVTLREVYHGALKGADLNMTRAHILGIASVLRSLGWEQRVMRRNGRPTRVWIPALPAEVVAEYMTHI